MSKLKPGQILRGQIDAMAFGGEGILRHEGQVVFIRFTAPGDVVEVEVTQAKKSFARAKLLSVITPAPDRIAPRCPHFGDCGGCQLQHVGYETQLKLKQDWVTQSLQRIGKMKTVVANAAMGAQTQWNYRRVVKLRFEYADKKLTLGYVNASSNGLMQVRTCPIFSEDLSLWANLNAFLTSALADEMTCSGRLSLFNADNAFYVGLLELDEDVLYERFAATLPLQLKGLVISTPKGRQEIGDTSLSLSQAGLNFTYTPHSFVQNHPEQSAKINDQVLDLVRDSGATSVFDLYCGFGVTAIRIARTGAKVTAVESNPESIQLARQNALANGVDVNWICDDVASFIEKGLRQSNPELVLVNPPRTGLAPRVTTALANYKPASIIYVSCMPQTLARDLALLTASGYDVVLCQPYDMFPQTTHVETVVLLQRLR